jgi:hypothetical protein
MEDGHSTRLVPLGRPFVFLQLLQWRFTFPCFSAVEIVSLSSVAKKWTDLFFTLFPSDCITSRNRLNVETVHLDYCGGPDALHPCS